MNEINLNLPQIADGEDKSSVLGNRLRKNYRHIRKWAKRTLTNCFRIYDKEIHQYPIVIDFYAGNFCVQYFARSRASEEPTQELTDEVENALMNLFSIESNKIFWRTRARRKETRQYEKKDQVGHFFDVWEYGLLFKINLTDYLDTGLFLDHRETRRIVAASSEGKRVLNLFAYTCSFSVHAAKAGALFTKSVDMSNTYTAWGRDNFIMNSIPLKNHEIVRADCLKFLIDELRSGNKYDIIIIDPPTISRSKKMSQLFDIQTDYISLITNSIKLLNEEGVIFFSTNSRKFIFDETLFKSCKIFEISEKTIPIDFHDKKIHRCWKIMKETPG